MNLAGRLARLEKKSAERAGDARGGSCPLCGASGEARYQTFFSSPGERPEPRPGCPRCGDGGVFVFTFDEARTPQRP